MHGHRLCLRNWNSLHIPALDNVLLFRDTVELIQEDLLDLSKHLVHRIDIIWAGRQQSQYLRAADLAACPSSAPAAPLRKPGYPRPPSVHAPPIKYAVRLGCAPGIYTSWPEVMRLTTGVHNDVRNFVSARRPRNIDRGHNLWGSPPPPAAREPL